MGFRFLFRGIWWCGLALGAVGALRGDDDADAGAAKFPQPEAWQVAGIRAAMADASPLVRAKAVAYCEYKHWVRPCLKVEDLLPLFTRSVGDAAARADPANWAYHSTVNALGELGREAPQVVVPALLPLLRDAHGAVNTDVLTALEKMGPAAAPYAGALLPLLQDPDLSVRRRVVKVLGEMGPEAAMEAHLALLPLLQDADKELKMAAVDALGRMGTGAKQAAAKALLPMLEDKGEFTDITGRHRVSVSDEVVEALKPMASEMEPMVKDLVLLAKDASKDIEVRIAATSLLAEMGPVAAPYARELLPLLKESKAMMKGKVAVSLAKMDPELAPEVAKELLLLPADDGVESTSWGALGNLGPAAAPVVVPAVLPLLKSAKSEDKTRALMTLEKMGPAAAPGVVAAVLPLLRDSDESVKRGAVSVLGAMGRQAAPHVRELLPLLDASSSVRENTEDPFGSNTSELQGAIRHALMQIGAADAPAALRVLLPLLQKSGGEEKERVMWALTAVGQHAAPAVVGDLLPLFRSPDADVSSTARLMVSDIQRRDPQAVSAYAPALLKLLTDSDSGVKIKVLQVLMLMDEKAAPSVVPVLLALLRDADSYVRYNAAVTLGAVARNDMSSLKQLLPLLKDSASVVREGTAKVLQFLNEKTAEQMVPSLLALLQDADSRVRLSVLEILAMMGPHVAPRVLPAVVPMLHDPDDEVKQGALGALVMMGPAATPYARELLPSVQNSTGRLRLSFLQALGMMSPKDAPMALPVLLPLLQDSDVELKRHTVTVLGKIGGESAATVVPALLRVLHDSDGVLRRETIHAIGEIGPQAASMAVPVLLPLLQDSDSEVKQYAVIALGKIVRETASTVVPALLPLLQGADSDVRNCTLVTLGKMGPAAASMIVPALLPLLKDPDNWVKLTALRGLGKMGPEVVPHAKELLPVLMGGGFGMGDRFDYEDALKSLEPEGQDAAPLLTALIREAVPRLGDTPGFMQGNHAVGLLSVIGMKHPEMVIPALQPLLQGASKKMKVAALEVMIRIGPDTASYFRQLLSMLPTPDKAVAQGADSPSNERINPEDLAVRGGVQSGLWQLSQQSTTEPVAVLKLVLPLLKNPDSRLQTLALWAVAEMAHASTAQVTKAMLPLLQDSSLEVQMKAVEALGKLGAAHVAIPALLPLRGTHDPQLAGLVMGALERLGKGAGPAAADELRRLLSDSDKPMKRHAADALSYMSHATPEFIQEVLPFLHDADGGVRDSVASFLGGMGKDAMPYANQLLPLLKDPDPWVRRAAACALGAIGQGTTAYLKDLQPLLGDNEFEVKCAAVQALRMMGEDSAPAVVPILLPLLQDANRAVKMITLEALVELGPVAARLAVPAVMRLLQDPDREVKRIAVSALGKMGREAAPQVKKLLPLLKACDKGMQIDAMHALAWVGRDAEPYVRLALPLLHDPDDNVRFSMAETLEWMCHDAVPYARDLLPLLKDPNGDVRGHAVLAFGHMGMEGVPYARHLVPLLQDSDGSAYHRVLTAFEDMGPEAAAVAVPALLTQLKQNDSGARVGVRRVLDHWGNSTHDPAWQCAVLAATADLPADEVQAHRFHLYLWSGRDADLLLSVRWLGQPSASPMPAQGLSVAEQQAVLGMLLRLWPASAAHPALRREMAGRIGEVAQGITAAPEPKVAALLVKLEAVLKADAVKDSQEAAAKARAAVQGALTPSSLNELRRTGGKGR